jgi:hypothetical protein
MNERSGLGARRCRPLNARVTIPTGGEA